MISIPEEFKVYRSYPVEVIRQADEEFRDLMFDGAGIEELQAGIRCYDFLCRASVVPEPLASMIEAHINEAEMRIYLLQQQEIRDKGSAEVLQKAIQAIDNMGKTARALLKRARVGFGSDNAFDIDVDEEFDEMMDLA